MLSQLLRGAGVVALGTALGQGMVLLATPWLARLYSPSEFGALALIATVSNVATATACLRYDLALPSCDGTSAKPLLKVAITAAFGVAMLVYCAGAVWALSRKGALPTPFGHSWLIALCVFLVGVYQVALGWATRLRAFGRVALIRFAQGFSFSVLAMLHEFGLVLAHVLSFAVAMPAVARAARSGRADDVGVVETAQRYSQFPLVSLPGALLDVMGYSLCIWIITGVFGAADAGQFAQIQRVVGAPLMLTGLSLGQVLLRHSSDVSKNFSLLQRLFRRVLGGVGLLSAVVVLSAATIGEPVLHWLLGPRWRVNVLFITPIAMAVSVRACASSLSTILITLRRFDLALYWQIAYFASAAIVLRFLASRLAFGGFVIAYGIHECCFYGAYLFLINYAIRSLPCAASSV